MLRMQLHSWKPARRLTKEGMTVTAETVYQELSDGHFIVIVLFPFKGFGTFATVSVFHVLLQ